MSKRLEVPLVLDRPAVRMLAWLLASHGANAGAELACASWFMTLHPVLRKPFAVELAAAKAELGTGLENPRRGWHGELVPVPPKAET